MKERRSPSKLTATHLTDSLCNALSAYMASIEEDCREIERSLDGVNGIFYESNGIVPAPVKKAVRANIAAIMNHLLELKAELNLNTKQMELINIINANVTRMWETAHESKGQQLRGFGILPDEVRDFLDTRMDEILVLVNRLRVALHGAAQKRNEDGTPEPGNE